VDSDVLRANPDRTILPGFVVDAIVEVPWGAHPTSFNPLYGYDSALHLAWVAAARSDEGTGEFLDRYVYGPADHDAYLAAVGGAERMAALAHWETG
ncbi:MAG: CoA transferase subunit A, partial [bacterium]|nr:CoA transferase subunit A [bacterium]